MSFIASAVGTKVAIAVLSLVAVGGGSAAAAAAAFPHGLPSDAPSAPTASPTDDSTEAPEPTSDATPSPSATKGPDASGPAAFGLCTAFAAGGLNSHSIAYAALQSASTSVGSIADYCAPILAAHGPGAHKPTTTPDSGEGHSQSQHGQSGQEHGSGAPATHGH